MKCHPDSIIYPHFLRRLLNLIGIGDRFRIWSLFSFWVLFSVKGQWILKGNNVEFSNTIERKRK